MPKKELLKTPLNDRVETFGVESRILAPSPEEDEIVQEVSLRPAVLSEFIGQKEVANHIQVMLEAAKFRNQALEHVLLAGPPGLGKTTLASIVAAELKVNLRITSGPAISRGGDLAAILTNLADKDVLFIDEIHRLSNQVEEILYPAMEDFQIDLVLGKGPMARSVRLDLPRFTLIGATTRAGLLTGPLRDRFGHIARLDFYDPDELSRIIKRAAKILGAEIDNDAAFEIARRSRGTPRIANRLLRRVRDVAQIKGCLKIDLELARSSLEFYGVDEKGLDKLDRKILEVLCSRPPGTALGLSTIASSIGEDPGTLEDVYEPFLIKQGLIERTPKGRVATSKAFGHLGIKGGGMQLF
jgi:Holliday junction DNA helicase RuvB